MTYRFATEKHDFARIDKLNALTDPATFYDDVRRLLGKRHLSCHVLNQWERLAELRYMEIGGKYVIFYNESRPLCVCDTEEQVKGYLDCDYMRCTAYLKTDVDMTDLTFTPKPGATPVKLS